MAALSGSQWPGSPARESVPLPTSGVGEPRSELEPPCRSRVSQHPLQSTHRVLSGALGGLGDLVTLNPESYHSRVPATASWSASGPPPGSPAPRTRPLRGAAAPTSPTASPRRGLQASLHQVVRDASHRICSPNAERAKGSSLRSLRSRSEATRKLDLSFVALRPFQSLGSGWE